MCSSINEVVAVTKQKKFCIRKYDIHFPCKTDFLAAELRPIAKVKDVAVNCTFCIKIKFSFEVEFVASKLPPMLSVANVKLWLYKKKKKSRLLLQNVRYVASKKLSLQLSTCGRADRHGQSRT